MLESVKNFLFEKFWLPIIDESVYYNPYNTFVYAILFGAIVLYVLRPYLEKKDIKIDRKFVLGFIPFIIFGGVLRALKDIKIANTILLETPIIYIILLGVGTGLLHYSKKIEELKNISYDKTLGITGISLILLILPFYSLKRPEAAILFITTTLAWAIPGFLLLSSLKPKFMDWEFTFPIIAHFLDATSTFTALSYGAEEKHVLGRMAISSFGGLGMFMLKIAVIVPIVFYINENFEGEEKTFYLFVIILLGLGIATRNLMQTLATS